MVAVAQRRQFSSSEKRRILALADACTEPGEIGALLRREGIYSSHLCTWRKQRDEEEVRGYHDALAWIHAEATRISVDEQAIKRLHAMTRGQIWDAGQYKEKDDDIIERFPDGSERVRFRTVSAAETATRMGEMVLDWRRCQDEGWVPPLIALAAFNLDFLCIHPFRDGNGRVSRLL